jgi:hypothetical protein
MPPRQTSVLVNNRRTRSDRCACLEIIGLMASRHGFGEYVPVLHDKPLVSIELRHLSKMLSGPSPSPAASETAAAAPAPPSAPVRSRSTSSAPPGA